MTIFFMLALSFGMLFFPVESQALFWKDFGTWKFIVNMFTHQLGHANLAHLVGNYVFMVPYAIYLESRIGRANFLAFYFLCGIFAAFSQVLGAGSYAMRGSSGAAYGVFAGACALFDRSAWQRITAFVILGIALTLEFLYAVNPTYSLRSGVAFWAHFGGGIAGMALVNFFLKNSQSSPQSKVGSCLKKGSRPS